MISTVTTSERSARRPTRKPRPLALLAALAGFTAAGITLALSLVVAAAGWFVTDGGGHGAPRDALRSGAIGWLLGHGSGVTIDGVALSAVPLGITLLVAWCLWRTGLRLGENLSGHGPDAADLADGVRDWTVPVATGVLTATYIVVAMVVGVLAGGERTALSTGSVVLWCLALCGLVGGVAIAIGSGRAATWLSPVPESVRAGAVELRRLIVWFLAASFVVLLVSFLIDLDAAVNVLSEMHTSPGEAAIFVLLSLLVVPNAVLFSGSYLLGPGFVLGTGTLVSPSLVAIGPVPLFPLLAALPDNGPTPAWTPYLVVVPVLVAVAAVFWTHRTHPTTAWEVGALRGVASGALAGLVFAVLAALAGGAVGPGRMEEVGPVVGETLLTGVVSFSLGGLLGGVLGTWSDRRRAAMQVTG